MKATLTQLAGLVTVVVGGVMVAGWGGGVVAVGCDLVYVGLAMESD